ncbi:hypothetical protein [Bartonella florencae]|nr:hypothetical protein [Bartonella florencae]
MMVKTLLLWAEFYNRDGVNALALVLCPRVHGGSTNKSYYV